MDKIWFINTLAISQSVLGTWDLLFLTLKCDLRKNKKSKVSKTQKKKMFVNPPRTTLISTELAMIVTKKRKETISFYLQGLINRIWKT
jgi:hypothetical protein